MVAVASLREAWLRDQEIDQVSFPFAVTIPGPREVLRAATVVPSTQLDCFGE